MTTPNFDYEGALKAGYNEQEINEFLSNQPSFKKTNQPGKFFENIKNNASNFFGNLGKDFNQNKSQITENQTIDKNLLSKVPNFDYQAALESGYSSDEINEFLKSQIPEKSLTEQGARIGGQFALGAAENALLPYEIGAAPLASKEAQQVPYRENLFETIEDFQQRKELSPKEWTSEDENILKDLIEQAKNPKISEPYIQTADIGIRGLAEKVTGQDLHPEGVLEKATNWMGFIKNPKNALNISKTGFKPKEILKAIAPTGTETLRGLGAGSALELAEQGNFGPIGTMASAVVGDLLGHSVSGTLKGTKKLITEPKKTLAEIGAKFTSKDKLFLQKELIKDFKDAGLQADIGTLTDSNLLKWTQSRLSQSGLTGKALDDFKRELTGQIEREYKSLANQLGEAKFITSHEAGEIAKESMKSIRESDLKTTRELYQNAEKSLKDSAFVNSKKLADQISRLEKQLKPGSIKSVEQQTVLNTLDKLKKDIYDSEGNLLYGKVKELINNKVAINDIINYEVQGGAKQLLKGVVAELDRAIISHGKENPSFAKSYIQANKRFSSHAKTFRSRDVERLLKMDDPAQLMNKMNTIRGIRSVQDILKRTPQGNQIFNSLKRKKLDDIVGDNLVNSTTQQAKLGTFSKLLEKGNNREIVKEILDSSAFKALERLQKNASKLADASEKFLNASKSGTVAVDAALLSQAISGIASMIVGNPWTLMKITGGILGARKLSSLLADPTFLKLVEEAILASEKGTQKDLIMSFERLNPYVMQALEINKSKNS